MLHAIGHRALSRENDAIGTGHRRGVLRDHDLLAGCDMLECLGNGTQVAHSIVDHGDPSHRIRCSCSRGRLQAALGRRDDIGRTRVKLDRHSQRPPKRFEHGFALMVAIDPAQVIDM